MPTQRRAQPLRLPGSARPKLPMRLFIALELPEWFRGELVKHRGGVPGARWVWRENLHLTLRFLGPTDGGQADDLAGELGRIDMPSFYINPTGAGVFESKGDVRALWMGMGPDEPLHDLNAKIERACRRAGFPPEARTFKPHITLARFDGYSNINRVSRFLERYARFQRESIRISGFSVFSSELRSPAPSYRVEADFPFSDAGLADSPFFDDWANAAGQKPIRTK